MSENLISCLTVYFTISAIVGCFISILMYWAIFCDWYDNPNLFEIVVLGSLGIILGWLIFPITIIIGLICVVFRLVKFFTERE